MLTEKQSKKMMTVRQENRCKSVSKLIVDGLQTYLLKARIDVHVKLLAVGGCRHGLREESEDVPYQTQLLPAGSSGSTTGPSSQDGGTSRKACLRKGKKCQMEREGGNKKSEKQ